MRSRTRLTPSTAPRAARSPFLIPAKTTRCWCCASCPTTKTRARPKTSTSSLAVRPNLHRCARLVSGMRDDLTLRTKSNSQDDQSPACIHAGDYATLKSVLEGYTTVGWMDEWRKKYRYHHLTNLFPASSVSAAETRRDVGRARTSAQGGDSTRAGRAQPGGDYIVSTRSGRCHARHWRAPPGYRQCR